MRQTRQTDGKPYNAEWSELIECEIDMARLMTALIGMMAESGEFAEVVKKESIPKRYTVHRRRDFSHEKRTR